MYGEITGEGWRITRISGGRNLLFYRARVPQNDVAIKFAVPDKCDRAGPEYTALAALQQAGLALNPAGPHRLCPTGGCSELVGRRGERQTPDHGALVAPAGGTLGPYSHGHTGQGQPEPEKEQDSRNQRPRGQRDHTTTSCLLSEYQVRSHHAGIREAA